MTLTYPNARRDETIVDDYHGKKISDPYRWMEDPDADETKEFVNAQNAITMPFLEGCPLRKKMSDKITEMWDYPKYGCPKKEGQRFFYFHNTGLQNQSVLYVQDSLDGEPRVFLDPNLLSDDGTVAITSKVFSEDGSIMAYGLSQSGSDWVTIKFRDSATGKDLEDTLERCKFTSIAWTHDHKGIFYNRYPESSGEAKGTATESNINQKLFYHYLGSKQSEDILCAEWPENPKWMTGAEVSDCGQYLIISIRQGCDPVNRLYYADLHAMKDGIKGLIPFVKLVDNFDAEYEYITNEGTVFTFKTNLKAPRYKLINIDFNKPSMSEWKDLVAEADKDVLEWAACVNNDKLVLCYLQDVKNQLYLYDLKSGDKVAHLPMDIGSVMGYSGKKQHKEIFYQFSSFLSPGIIFRCDVSAAPYEPKIFRQVSVKDFDPAEYEQKQVFYESKDGTKIPMFIVQRKGIERTGENPVLLYGYGGFNISLSPYFSVSRLMLLKYLGGVYALANIRGGGEYGEEWHKGGMVKTKQNCFDDFAAAAEYLIKEKYTNPKKLVIQGGSNGGLLVAACANQRPELFGCVINQVGVMDILRFHKFTIGHAWTSDFGCSEKKDEFEYQIKYSPLHNINKPSKEGKQYPAMLLMTADHDDRVVPAHSLKYIAELQYQVRDSEQTNPLMIRIDTKAGHGRGKPTQKVIDEITDIYCYVVNTLGLTWKE